MQPSANDATHDCVTSYHSIKLYHHIGWVTVRIDCPKTRIQAVKETRSLEIQHNYFKERKRFINEQVRHYEKMVLEIDKKR